MQKANKRQRPWAAMSNRADNDKMQLRKRSHSLYHTSRWTREAKAYKELHPLCAHCLNAGRVQATDVVDHIIPYPHCHDFWDQHNWQALCHKCNIVKGNKDKIKYNNNVSL